MRTFGLLISLLILIYSCQFTKDQETFVPPLVQIDSKKLYESEIENIIHDETSSYDSAAIANAYIDRWIKEQLLIRDANKYLSSDFEIEELVNDYRNQLIKYRYEQAIMDKFLDTEINSSDLEAYYEKNKSNYILSQPIYKVIFASVPETTEKIDRLYNAWLNNEFEFIQKFCDVHADTFYMDRTNG